MVSGLLKIQHRLPPTPAPPNTDPLQHRLPPTPAPPSTDSFPGSDPQMLSLAGPQQSGQIPQTLHDSTPPPWLFLWGTLIPQVPPGPTTSSFRHRPVSSVWAAAFLEGAITSPEGTSQGAPRCSGKQAPAPGCARTVHCTSLTSDQLGAPRMGARTHPRGAPTQLYSNPSGCPGRLRADRPTRQYPQTQHTRCTLPWCPEVWEGNSPTCLSRPAPSDHRHWRGQHPPPPAGMLAGQGPTSALSSSPAERM